MLRLWLQSTPLTPDEVLPELFLIKESAPKKLKDVCITPTHRTNKGRKNENKYFKTIKKLQGSLDTSINAHVKKNYVKHLD